MNKANRAPTSMLDGMRSFAAMRSARRLASDASALVPLADPLGTGCIATATVALTGIHVLRLGPG